MDQLTATYSAAPAEEPMSSLASEYRLGPGDKLRVRVFGEPELSGDFVVDSGGAVDLPLIGEVAAGGGPVSDFQQRVVTSYKDGYLRDPKVSIEVLNYRPFFILGEVRNAGEYDYKSSLTVQDAVAIAGGYTYRANGTTAYIRRAGADEERPFDLSQRVPVYPGDIVRIPERFF
ncbi:MAG TPA: polysaccharide biosynthesis/export family protein [Afifellaceae bacterium]|nr:polysaccharide biosynthesis/export family protein [Afifellaceae bacterium]